MKNRYAVAITGTVNKGFVTNISTVVSVITAINIQEAKGIAFEIYERKSPEHTVSFMAHCLVEDNTVELLEALKTAVEHINFVQNKEPMGSDELKGMINAIASAESRK